tara:strand:+ start:1350 stop:1460 length:111 start_codon:yes stop_codon:yes gene_type:complete
MLTLIIDTSLLDDFSKEEFGAILEQLENMGCIVTRD